LSNLIGDDRYVFPSRRLERANYSEILNSSTRGKKRGKKWFAFSLLEVESFGLMGRVKKAMG
jgi:hypothetical protein